MPHKKSHRYDDFPTSCSSSKSSSKHCKSTSSYTSYSTSSCYPSSSVCYSSSSSCKKGKCKCKYNPYLGCNPCYPNPCSPCNPANPYYPGACNPYYNGNPCVSPCGPNPCGPCPSPCAPSPCNSIKTYNPYLYPNYTVYEITTLSYTIPSTACTTYYIYTMEPPSSPSSTPTINLPLIGSLDCGKKRNFILTNKGDSTIQVVSSGTDTFNGVASPYLLTPGQSITLYSDTVSNWTVV